MNDVRQASLLDPATCDPLDLVLEHAADLPPQHRWPALLREMVEVLCAYNERALHWSPKQAADDAVERVVVLAEYLGGRFVYLPRGDVLRSAAREAVIYRLSIHMSTGELARAFGLSEVHVYRLIAQQRAIVIDRMQGKLFDDATGGNADPSRPVGAQ